MATNYFSELNSIDVQDKIEKKNGLSYLSWAYAWGELKKRHPEATYTIYENANGLCYHTDGNTAWVKTGVTVNGIEHIEYLPVMDYKNKSIPLSSITSFDVNKTIQRSLTKAVARHGLGLYVYAGEDLPEETTTTKKVTKTTKTASKPKEVKVEQPKEDNFMDGMITEEDLFGIVDSCTTIDMLKAVYTENKEMIIKNQDLLDKITAKRTTLKVA